MIDELNFNNGFKHPFKKDNISLSFIFSYSDKASLNIFNNLKSNFNLKEVESSNDQFKLFEATYNSYNLFFYGFNEDMIYLKNLNLKGDSFIFLSKHSSNSKKPCLTVHTTGNFSKAEYGGKDKKISEPAPYLHKALISSLDELTNHSEEVVLEATHHGPYFKKPHVFIEIGSDEKRWTNKNLGKIISKSILYSLKNKNKLFPKYFGVGLGGPHYCYEFTKISVETPISIPIIVPKYALKHIDEKMLKDLSKYSKNFILDWKGLGKEKDRLLSLIEDNGFKYFRNDKIKKFFRN